MISQSLFLELITNPNVFNVHIESNNREEKDRFVKPYVFVLHQPGRVGFYLSEDLRHIISVDCCREPENPVRIERGHLPAGFSSPPWVLEIRLPEGVTSIYDYDGFDTFWLY